MRTVQLTEFQLVCLNTILSAVETHKDCASPISETHHYYPGYCLDALISRWKEFNGDELLKIVELALLNK